MSILELIPTDENLLALEQGITEEFEGTLKNVYDSSVTETNTIGARVVIKFHCPNLYPCGNGYCDMCLSHCLTIVTFDEPRSFGVDYVIPNSENGGGESSHSGGGAVDLENIINNPVFSDPTGYFFDPNMPPIGVDEYFRNREASAFWNSLSEGVNGEKAWANQHPNEYSEIIEYYLDNFSDENELFSNEIIDRMILNPEIFTSVKPFIIEKQINDSQLNPCAKGVFQQAKNTTNSDFSEVLAKLGANESIYNTTLISAVAPSGAPAQTVRNSAFNYTIYISTNYEDKTKLFIAASMFHELLHAYFISIVDDYNLIPNNQNIYNLQSFPSLYQAFCDKKYPPTGQTAANAHHADMAILYVDAIATAIKEYAIATGTSSSLPNLDQICKDMAWGGLIGTPVFDDINTPLTSDDRTRILNRYEAEQRNLPIGNISNIQNPISQPCN